VGPEIIAQYDEFMNKQKQQWSKTEEGSTYDIDRAADEQRREDNLMDGDVDPDSVLAAGDEE
jgi:hypothetical protein